MDHGACVPIRVHTIVISVQHSDTITLEDLRKGLMDDIIKVRAEWMEIIKVRVEWMEMIS